MVCDNSIFTFPLMHYCNQVDHFCRVFYFFYKPMVSASAMLFGGILQLRKYEEVIQLCERSLSFAEKNFASLSTVAYVEGSGCQSYSTVRLWRWCLISKCYFHMGRLEAALDLLQKLEQERSTINKYYRIFMKTISFFHLPVCSVYIFILLALRFLMLISTLQVRN